MQLIVLFLLRRGFADEIGFLTSTSSASKTDPMKQKFLRDNYPGRSALVVTAGRLITRSGQGLVSSDALALPLAQIG